MTTRIAPSLFSLFVALTAVKAQYTTTVDPNDLPETTQPNQYGYNDCGTGNNQTSLCQNLYVNSITDFCLWGPPSSAPVGTDEQIMVAYCTLPGRGTRLIPAGAITAAHFIETPDYIQITGVGDLTGLGIAPGDEGGELDPHGADGLGNPHGGLVFSNVWDAGENNLGQQIHEWTNFMAADQFCIRVCKPGGNDTSFCQHIYDEMGCNWNMPGNYNDGFDTCLADDVIPMGMYPQPNGSFSTWNPDASYSTWYQSDTTTNTVLPSAQLPANTSSCTNVPSSQIFAAAPTTAAAITTGSGSGVDETGDAEETFGEATTTRTSSASTSTSSTGAGFASAPLSFSSLFFSAVFTGMGAFTLLF